jgi:hypothetical protein
VLGFVVVAWVQRNAFMALLLRIGFGTEDIAVARRTQPPVDCL